MDSPPAQPAPRVTRRRLLAVATPKRNRDDAVAVASARPGPRALRRREVLASGAALGAGALIAGMPLAGSASAAISDLPGVGAPPELAGLRPASKKLLRETMEALSSSERSWLPAEPAHIEAGCARLMAYYGTSSREARAAIETSLARWGAIAEQGGWAELGVRARLDLLRAAVASPPSHAPAHAVASFATSAFLNSGTTFVPVDF